MDMRDDDEENDTMENWDEEKLKEVIDKKHGAATGGKLPTTDIVSSIWCGKFTVLNGKRFPDLQAFCGCS